VALGKWSAGQIFQHLAKAYRSSVEESTIWSCARCQRRRTESRKARKLGGEGSAAGSSVTR
jgi:hypothetical protein